MIVIGDSQTKHYTLVYTPEKNYFQLSRLSIVLMSKSQLTRIPAIEGLRGFACCYVFLMHFQSAIHLADPIGMSFGELLATFANLGQNVPTGFWICRLPLLSASSEAFGWVLAEADIAHLPALSPDAVALHLCLVCFLGKVQIFELSFQRDRNNYR